MKIGDVVENRADTTAEMVIAFESIERASVVSTTSSWGYVSLEIFDAGEGISTDYTATAWKERQARASRPSGGVLPRLITGSRGANPQGFQVRCPRQS